MESLIACGPSDDNPKQHVFLVKWKGFAQEENMWETYENVAEHDMGSLKDYYERNLAMERDGRFGVKERKNSYERKIRVKKIIGGAMDFTLLKVIFVLKDKAPLGSLVLEKGVMLGVVS